VDVESNPEYLRSLAASVDKFRDEFASFLELCDFTPLGLGAGMLPAVMPQQDVPDDAIADAKERVSRAAGRIADLPNGARVRIQIAGAGAFDVFDAWLTVTQPKPLFQPDDVLAACNNVIGRLEAMAEKAEYATPVRVDAEAMHPLVWGAARGRWRSEHYRDAVQAAAGAVVDHVRQLTGRSELDEKDVFSQAFAEGDPQPGKPRLRWPGDPTNQTVRSMNVGLKGMASAVQSAIRNPSVHVREEMSPQEAAERLAAVSLLAGWIENCIVARADGEEPSVS
jgi:uncharacterized protein (TIGR02391 family)